MINNVSKNTNSNISKLNNNTNTSLNNYKKLLEKQKEDGQLKKVEVMLDLSEEREQESSNNNEESDANYGSWFPESEDGGNFVCDYDEEGKIKNYDDELYTGYPVSSSSGGDEKYQSNGNVYEKNVEGTLSSVDFRKGVLEEISKQNKNMKNCDDKKEMSAFSSCNSSKK